MRDVARDAVAAAVAAGADYADARAILRRSQSVSTRNETVETVSDAESGGVGVRVLVGGAWGFACDRGLGDAGAREAALRAVGFARASARRTRRRVELVPVPPARGEYRTPAARDPVDVPLEEKIDLCLRAEKGLRRPKVEVTQASVRAQREVRAFASSEGADALQTFVECGGGIEALAVDEGRVQSRSFPSSHGGSSAQAGWEYVEGLGLEREGPRVAEEAVALLSAPPCPASVTTLVLDAEQMQLQVHESVGHAIELDRIYGTEAAYAGTSFLHPEDLGSLGYGSAEVMHVTADATTPGGLGTCAFDDEGVAARREPVVVGGVLSGFLSSRETAAALGALGGGSMRADGWSRMPLVRMTNLHLEPGQGSLEDLLADVDDGVYLATNKSWSIDDKRLNFQFGTEIAWEVKRGRLGRMLRDATYTGETPSFWGSLDAVAGPGEWRMHGLTNCGKGQPGQHAHVSHGAPPARFRGVQVGVRS